MSCREQGWADWPFPWRSRRLTAPPRATTWDFVPASSKADLAEGAGVGGGTCLAWGAEIEVQKSPPQPRLRPAPTPPPGALYKLGPRARKESEYPSYPRPWFLHSVFWP